MLKSERQTSTNRQKCRWVSISQSVCKNVFAPHVSLCVCCALYCIRDKTSLNRYSGSRWGSDVCPLGKSVHKPESHSSIPVNVYHLWTAKEVWRFFGVRKVGKRLVSLDNLKCKTFCVKESDLNCDCVKNHKQCQNTGSVMQNPTFRLFFLQVNKNLDRNGIITGTH